jgi:hypothetical protein
MNQSNPSIFNDDWRTCLREQYMHVIRTGDQATLPSLTALMISELNFTEAELVELRVMATMHVDDVAEDFVPDLNVLRQAAPQPVPVPQIVEEDEDDDDEDDFVQLSLF